MSKVESFWPHEARNIRCVRESDYARLEQECERLRRIVGASAACAVTDRLQEEELDGYLAAGIAELQGQRDATLKLLARCQEHLDPHRDAALWSDVCAALGPKL